MPDFEAVRHDGRRLGRRPPKNAPRLHLADFLTGAIPTHPLVADHLSAVRRWMLGGNGTWGTCGPTYIANLMVLIWKYLLGEDITVSDAAVFKLYRASGNPNFDPNLSPDDPRQQDDGVDMQTMLEAFAKFGIDITHADGTVENVKPLAFASVAHDSFDKVRAATSILGAVGFGLNLELAQRAQTDAGGPWDYQASGVWGGHATLGGRYTSQSGPHQTDETLVTWAEEMGTTDAFMGHQLEEVWGVIMPAHLNHPAFQQGVDLAALAADYKALTGRDFPAVVPPPAPAPPPGPPPPAPGPLPPKPPPGVLQWLRDLLAWLERLFG